MSLLYILLASHGSVVQQYSDYEFDSTVRSGIHFVDFYAPWCGHCRNLEPTWQGLAEKVADEAPQLTIAKVDATQEQALTVRLGIRSYPTLLLFDNGASVYKYEGARSLEALEEFARGGFRDKPVSFSWYPSRLLFLPMSWCITAGVALEEGMKRCMADGATACAAFCGALLVGVLVVFTVGLILFEACFGSSGGASTERAEEKVERRRRKKAD